MTEKGEKGWIGSYYNTDSSLAAVGDVVETKLIDETNCFISTSYPKNITERWMLKLNGKLKPRSTDQKFEFGLTVAGRAKVCPSFCPPSQIRLMHSIAQLFVDGKLIIDNWTRQRRGVAFFGSGTAEETGSVDLKAGVAHDILVEYVNVRGPADGDEDETLCDVNPAVRLGGAPVIDGDGEISKAVRLATEADVAIVVVGLNSDWETEGYDRKTLSLAGRTDELVEKVLAANKNTVVVTQSVRGLRFSEELQ